MERVLFWARNTPLKSWKRDLKKEKKKSRKSAEQKLLPLVARNGVSHSQPSPPPHSPTRAPPPPHPPPREPYLLPARPVMASTPPPPPVIGKAGNLTVFITPPSPAEAEAEGSPDSPRSEFTTPSGSPRAAEDSTPPPSPPRAEQPPVKEEAPAASRSWPPRRRWRRSHRRCPPRSSPPPPPLGLRRRCRCHCLPRSSRPLGPRRRRRRCRCRRRSSRRRRRGPMDPCSPCSGTRSRACKKVGDWLNPPRAREIWFSLRWPPHCVVSKFEFDSWVLKLIWWAFIAAAHASLDEYISNWFGLDQSKYQWALNEYYESNGKVLASTLPLLQKFCVLSVLLLSIWWCKLHQCFARIAKLWWFEREFSKDPSVLWLSVGRWDAAVSDPVLEWNLVAHSWFRVVYNCRWW